MPSSTGLHTVLIAPNAFKGGLDARAAAAAIADGLRSSPLHCRALEHPVADGGDGTAGLLARHRGARTVTVAAEDPLGRPRPASFGMTGDGMAIIGVADASGLALLADGERQPLLATSYGTGQLIGAALDQGARSIVLGLGGSATIDGGTGLARALGIGFRDAAGQLLPPAPAALADLAAIDLTGCDPRLADCRITLLCDVATRMVGSHGAAAVYGPQKGASPEDVRILNEALTRLAAVLEYQFGVEIAELDRGGAAGGIAAGLHALVGAELVDGADHFLDLTHFDTAVAAASLVVTGEGAIDDQSLEGKAPCAVARRAKAQGRLVVAMAGSVPDTVGAELRRHFDMLLAIGARPTSLDEAIAATERNLRRCAEEVGAMLAGILTLAGEAAI